jgi:protein involved in polysaccharide export with SLBB domain
VEGDSLNDLLQIAHGLTAYADHDSVFLYRLSLDGDSLYTRHVDLRAVTVGRSADIPLEPGDRVVVRPLRDFRRDYTVVVLGEVVYPGVYPIARSGVRLTEAIAMAGGFTEHAMISGAYVTRKAGSRGFVVDSLMSLRGRNAQEDYGYYTVEAALLTQHHNVRVDFDDVFVRGDSTQNVLLVPGDTVTVPTRTRSVYVFGQVVRPGYVPYVPGWSADAYVAQSGGYNEAALEGDIRIVKARTGQWVAEDATTIEEGDYVWVPKDPERGFGYYLGVVAQSAAIISVAISTVVIVSQIGK